MKTLILPLIALLLSCESFAAAEVFEKNGYPCMSNICIGDEASSLQSTTWKPVKVRAVTKDNLPRRIERTYRAKPEILLEAAPYLDDGFDNQGLKAIEKVDASCEMAVVTGSFTTDSGNETHVALMLIPDASLKKQKWVVYSITRKFPKVVSEAQMKETKATLDKRYANFEPSQIQKSKKKPKAVMVFMPLMGAQVQLMMVDKLPTPESLKHHPACGGSQKISVD